MPQDVFQSRILTRKGLSFRVDYVHDPLYGPPWEEYENRHGIVSDWTTREPEPGEVILSKQENSYRYYNVFASLQKAKEEDWGVNEPQGKTEDEVLTEAVMEDFKYLKSWCDDEWHWCDVFVQLLDVKGNDVFLKDSTETRDRIESNASEYLEEVADDLMQTICRRFDGTMSVTIQIRQESQ